MRGRWFTGSVTFVHYDKNYSHSWQGYRKQTEQARVFPSATSPPKATQDRKGRQSSTIVPVPAIPKVIEKGDSEHAQEKLTEL